ncbi:unnamed protein product [Rotaria sordida]|uniref:Ubiquitin-conjugating enzyme E2 J2 n=1 Tax=Rotaria sordida TaxID=392033 RepID=A0A813TYP5_9BILA|nr:unnamed protein product [Rotaria sordida]CAF0859047.1 unnamed protein product [Rotaria sordida]CAF0862397.1 unnamed protein product [Rotaria sordida]CAF3843398.1 unnamed protein product [Rotaria sordida]CAF3930217.1 unnamed protein product [Rotaria sordida]
MSMKSNSAFQRLQTDYRRLIKDPIPYLMAQPLSSNLLEWRFVIRGPNDTPYQGGIYQGKIIFPYQYPFKPPSIYMLTPNGRFQIDKSLCLTITSYHPDSWNPSWSISSILNGFLSFMCDTSSTHGSIQTSYAQKCKYAYDSLSYNIQDSIFCELFPDITEEIKRILIDRIIKTTSNKSLVNNFNQEQQSLISLTTNNNNSISTSWLNSLINNIMIIIFLTAFAILVRFILNSTNDIQ